MNLAEFRIIYNRRNSAIHHVAVSKLNWLAWVDLARWILQREQRSGEINCTVTTPVDK